MPQPKELTVLRSIQWSVLALFFLCLRGPKRQSFVDDLLSAGCATYRTLDSPPCLNRIAVSHTHCSSAWSHKRTRASSAVQLLDISVAVARLGARIRALMSSAEVSICNLR